MSPSIPSSYERAKLSLEGLALGDAFGDRFFAHEAIVANMVAARAMPMAPWRWTDDTEMALSIVSVLRRHEEIDRDALAFSFAERYDRSRKYGASMHGLLARIHAGKSWREEAGALFAGQGSYGNGAAMRVAPVGAYFADDLDVVVTQARRAAEVTHAHPEAIAGAIAVAVAAALAWQERGHDTPRFLDLVLPYVPASEVRDGIRRARGLAPGASVRLAVAALGNGTRISAPDTVPFALWCAAQHLDDYQEALWLTVEGLGDRDTTCAMVGGIVALRVGSEGLPHDWLRDREPLPNWPFEDQGSLETITLYRPIGKGELDLIWRSGFRAFPPRLPEQPIFYPVLSEAYATQIARDWNTRDAASGYAGYVTRFRVRTDFLRRYEVQTVGHGGHQEYWIPSEDLSEFNLNISGPIEVVGEFLAPNEAGQK